MTTLTVEKLRVAHLRGDPVVKMVDGQRRYRIACPADTDPLAVFSSATPTYRGRVTIVGGDLIPEAGPFHVDVRYDLDSDTVPAYAALVCACDWAGRRRTWRYRRLMIQDAVRHVCEAR